MDAADVSALQRAIEEDDAFYEEEAERLGTSVQNVKATRKMERENAQLRAAMQENNRREQAAQQYATWMQQAQEAKRIYPSLDLDVEARNPQFVQLLQAGIDVGSAYLVLHKDEIIPAAMQHTARTVEKKLTSAIAAGSGRPAENGTGAQGAAAVKSDVTQLTGKDLAEVHRRVARGERISFG